VFGRKVVRVDAGLNRWGTDLKGHCVTSSRFEVKAKKRKEKPIACGPHFKGFDMAALFHF